MVMTELRLIQDEIRQLQERVSLLEAAAEALQHRHTPIPALASGYGAPPADEAA